MPRLFTAIDPPDAVRSQLEAYCDARDESFEVRWTPPENYHITLRFIGDVTDAQADAVASALTAVQGTPFALDPLGLGVLPSRRTPRVLMISFDSSDSLQTLYHDVDDALASVGIDRETRSYRPHLTIARLQDADPRAVRSFLQSTPVPQLDAFQVDRFTLYESILKPDGAVHEPRATYPLR